MRQIRSSLRCLLFAVLCATSIGASAKAHDAVIVHADAKSRAELQRVIAHSLNRESVRLADDALTRDSVLIIEPARVRDSEGKVIYDREPRVLEHFRLVKGWWRCYLIRESTNERLRLRDTQCNRR